MIGLRWILAAVATFALAAPMVAAQGNAMFSLSVEGAPKTVDAAGISSEGMSLKFIAKNVVCSGAANFLATLNVAAVPEAGTNTSANQSQATVEVAPATLTYTLAQGAYGSGSPVAGYQDAKPFTVTLTKPANLTGVVNFTVTVSASIPASSGAECRDTGTSRAAITAAPVAYVVNFRADAPPLPSPTPKLPVPPGFALLGLAAAAFLRLRSRSA